MDEFVRFFTGKAIACFIPTQSVWPWIREFGIIVVVFALILTLACGLVQQGKKAQFAGSLDPLLLLYIAMTMPLLLNFLSTAGLGSGESVRAAGGALGGGVSGRMPVLTAAYGVTSFFGLAHLVFLIAFRPGGINLTKVWLACCLLLPFAAPTLSVFNALNPARANLETIIGLYGLELPFILPMLLYGVLWNKYFSWRRDRISARLAAFAEGERKAPQARSAVQSGGR